ncbi:DUF2273 domain-containing protein [Amnibacterium kyonggiense]|uniref:Small integral membrane protein DUF2273 n=2 Tax=Amnibacterium kyonggiense TaxID=595671 RepID=A0A4R7FSE9_9MICO|nr:DUF2273 domain-containing protein [Amnibacterium kyonggiense]TDS80781.1 hypothetical protein CLV52_1350 [Amnibacterium kyonggiense]
MTTSQQGMAIAAVLAIVWIAFNFGAMILVALAIVLGFLIGRYVEGRLDVSGIVSAVRGRRSSS